MLIFLNKFSEISSSHFGFLPDKFTSDAMNKCIEFAYESFRDKISCLNNIIDFSKGFDTINHHVLLTKLELYRIRGNALGLLRSYLSYRKQFLRIGNNFFLIEM